MDLSLTSLLLPFTLTLLGFMSRRLFDVSLDLKRIRSSLIMLRYLKGAKREKAISDLLDDK